MKRVPPRPFNSFGPEEIALCKAWCDVSENRANTLNFEGFWSEVLACFENEMGEKIQRYDAVALKWKKSLRPKIVAFTAVYKRVKQMDENGSSDLVVFQNALAEYETQYDQAFTTRPRLYGLAAVGNFPQWAKA
ncbi:hypothetical protein Tco_1304717 [Tanacetum coccineum]